MADGDETDNVKPLPTTGKSVADQIQDQVNAEIEKARRGNLKNIMSEKTKAILELERQKAVACMTLDDAIKARNDELTKAVRDFNAGLI